MVVMIRSKIVKWRKHRICAWCSCKIQLWERQGVDVYAVDWEISENRWCIWCKMLIDSHWSFLNDSEETFQEWLIGQLMAELGVKTHQQLDEYICKAKDIATKINREDVI